MPHFNLAWAPRDKELAARLTGRAQAYFSGRESGYVLGTGALPHVTACQFESAPDDAREIFSLLAAQLPPTVIFTIGEPYFFPTQEKKDAFWTGLGVRKDAALIQMQQHIFDEVRSRGRVCFTPSGDAHFPHLTFARLEWVVEPATRAALGDGFLNTSHEFEFSLGICGAHGVYPERLL